MTAANPPSTPIAMSKSAALSRVLDLAVRGYHFYCSGQCPARRLVALAQKFHDGYGIACSPGQRILRKRQGMANAALVMYLRPDRTADTMPEETTGKPPCPASLESSAERQPGAQLDASMAHVEAPGLISAREALEHTQGTKRLTLEDVLRNISPDTPVEWLLMATAGAGPVHEQERLRCITDKHRLRFCGYELVRHSVGQKSTWTFRRTKEEMASLYALLGEQLKRRHMSRVAESLQRIARQPGFAGVREQSKTLCQFARQKGYEGELPFLFFIQKLSHGERLVLRSGRDWRH